MRTTLWRVHYEAVPDKDTVINMTNHSYFNLNGHESGTALDIPLFWMQIPLPPRDAESIPTGEIRSVEGTPMDFRRGKTLGEEDRRGLRTSPVRRGRVTTTTGY